MAQADIGLIGLAVMGQNLVLNMEDKGFAVAVYNRTPEKTANFLGEKGEGRKITGTYSLPELVAAVKRPRKIMLMVKAGQPVDDFIDQLLPLLEKGDIIIDGGNSHFPDTIRRTKKVEEAGLLYIGTGVSGGEEGALKGPSIMPGVLRRPGSTWRRSFKRSPPRCRKVRPAVYGWETTAPAISSRWCTTGSNTGICS